MTDKKKEKLVTVYVKGRRPEKMTPADAAKRLDAANQIETKPETGKKEKPKSER